jgi:hypothetical protein
MDLDLSTLNPLAHDFARRLFDLYPQWRSLARAVARNHPDIAADNVASPDNGGHFLAVTVTAPGAPDRVLPLLIETDAYDVTVSFDQFHAHCPWPAQEPDDPLTLIAELLREDFAVISHATDDGPFGGGTPMPRDAVPPRRPRQPDRHLRARIRSWKGTLDRDY